MIEEPSNTERLGLKSMENFVQPLNLSKLVYDKDFVGTINLLSKSIKEYFNVTMNNIKADKNYLAKLNFQDVKTPSLDSNLGYEDHNYLLDNLKEADLKAKEIKLYFCKNINSTEENLNVFYNDAKTFFRILREKRSENKNNLEGIINLNELFEKYIKENYKVYNNIKVNQILSMLFQQIKDLKSFAELIESDDKEKENYNQIVDFSLNKIQELTSEIKSLHNYESTSKPRSTINETILKKLKELADKNKQLISDNKQLIGENNHFKSILDSQSLQIKGLNERNQKYLDKLKIMKNYKNEGHNCNNKNYTQLYQPARPLESRFSKSNPKKRLRPQILGGSYNINNIRMNDTEIMNNTNVTDDAQNKKKSINIFKSDKYCKNNNKLENKFNTNPNTIKKDLCIGFNTDDNVNLTESNRNVIKTLKDRINNLKDQCNQHLKNYKSSIEINDKLNNNLNVLKENLNKSLKENENLNEELLKTKKELEMLNENLVKISQDSENSTNNQRLKDIKINKLTTELCKSNKKLIELNKESTEIKKLIEQNNLKHQKEKEELNLNLDNYLKMIEEKDKIINENKIGQTKEFAMIKNDLQKKNDEILNNKKIIFNMEFENKNLKNKLSSNESQLSDLSTTNQNLYNELNTKNEEIEQANYQINKLNIDLKSSNEELELLKKENESLKLNIEKLKDEINKLIIDNQNIKKDNKTLNNDNAKYNKIYEELKSSLQENEKNKADNQNLRNEILLIKSKNIDLDTNIKDIKKENNNLKEIIRNQTNEMEILNQKIDNYDVDFQKKNEEVSELTLQNLHLQKNITESSNNNNSTDNSEIVFSLKKELMTKNEELESMKQKLNEKEHAYEDNLKELKKENKKLLEQKIKLSDNLNELQNDIDTHRRNKMARDKSLGAKKNLNKEQLEVSNRTNRSAKSEGRQKRKEEEARKRSSQNLRVDNGLLTIKPGNAEEKFANILDELNSANAKIKKLQKLNRKLQKSLDNESSCSSEDAECKSCEMDSSFNEEEYDIKRIINEANHKIKSEDLNIDYPGITNTKNRNKELEGKLKVIKFLIEKIKTTSDNKIFVEQIRDIVNKN